MHFCSRFLPIALLFAASVTAHHSPAMFDMQKVVTLEGAVREFQWTNPHCYIQLLVTNDQGEEQEWSLEMGAPMYLYNRGWRPSTLKAGDSVSVTIAPLGSGDRGGLVLQAVLADGRTLGERKP